VLAYRATVDEALEAFFRQAGTDTRARATPLLELGLHHEQQHQELLLTDSKFMAGQLVLRGSSFATAAGYARLGCRNFFPPAVRWQFSGLRPARDLGL
jgi:formylglycine-generating enzyme required for sulfatase activity